MRSKQYVHVAVHICGHYEQDLTSLFSGAQGGVGRPPLDTNLVHFDWDGLHRYVIASDSVTIGLWRTY